MSHIAEDVCTASLGQYADAGFRLYELDDHTVELCHIPCGFKDKFSSTGVTITAIRNDCENHLKNCPEVVVHLGEG